MTNLSTVSGLPKGEESMRAPSLGGAVPRCLSLTFAGAGVVRRPSSVVNASEHELWKSNRLVNRWVIPRAARPDSPTALPEAREPPPYWHMSVPDEPDEMKS